MDVSLNSSTNAASAMPRGQLAQAVQIAVLKKAIDTQAAGTLSLLQGVTGTLPLASSGALGTKLNELA